MESLRSGTQRSLRPFPRHRRWPGDSSCTSPRRREMSSDARSPRLHGEQEQGVVPPTDPGVRIGGPAAAPRSRPGPDGRQAWRCTAFSESTGSAARGRHDAARARAAKRNRGADRRQPGVAAPRRVAALPLEMVEEAAHEVGVEILQGQVLRRLAENVPGVEHQQTERVAVAGDGVSACAALLHEMRREERTEQPCEGRDARSLPAPIPAGCRAAGATCSMSSGTAVRYQWVPSIPACPSQTDRCGRQFPVSAPSRCHRCSVLTAKVCLMSTSRGPRESPAFLRPALRESPANDLRRLSGLHAGATLVEEEGAGTRVGAVPVAPGRVFNQGAPRRLVAGNDARLPVLGVAHRDQSPVEIDVAAVQPRGLAGAHSGDPQQAQNRRVGRGPDPSGHPARLADQRRDLGICVDVRPGTGSGGGAKAPAAEPRDGGRRPGRSSRSGGLRRAGAPARTDGRPAGARPIQVPARW